MIVHIDHLLSRLGQAHSTQLFSGEALAHVSEIARMLPMISGGLALECRLEEGASRVDFMVCCMRSDGGPKALSEGLESTREQLPGSLWDGVRAFSREWLSAQSPLSRVPIFWLEYDVVGAISEVPRPFPFVCIQEELSSGPSARRGSHRQQVEASRELAWHALEVLRGRQILPAVRHTVSRCFELLPESAEVEHVAPLDCRGSEAVRLVIGLPREQVGTYLDGIGWPGPRSQVEVLLRDWLPHLGYVEINVDAGEDGIAPTIGLSLPLPADTNVSWVHEVLQRMVEQGVCTPGKRDAVLAWSGSERVVLEGDRWPSKLCRTIGLKLVCRPNEPVTVKTYPYFECRFSLWG